MKRLLEAGYGFGRRPATQFRKAGRFGKIGRVHPTYSWRNRKVGGAGSEFAHVAIHDSKHAE